MKGMLEDQLIEEFRQRLDAETEAQLQELESDQSQLAIDAALSEVMLGYLEEAGALSEHVPCPYEDVAGRNRCRILAYAMPEDSTRLELITGRYVSLAEGDYLPKGEISDLAGRAARFFEHVLRSDLTRFDGNEEASAAARYLSTNLARVEEVRVHILTNANVRIREVDDISIGSRRIEFSVWDVERLYRASGEEITRDRILVDFAELTGRPLPTLEMKPPPEEYQTFLLVLPGDVICELYDRFGPRLFEFNVRSFLQARGQVNKGIRDTLRTTPERFLAYNNGLTATADEIKVGSFHGETVIHSLKGLQIVNGAQTTASIHRAKKIDRIDVSRVAVSMKLTRVQPEKLGEFVPLIAKYANTQNPVQLADLSANNEFHIAIERLSELIWSPGEECRWFYERARGAYEVARMRAGTTPAKRRTFDQECPKTRRFSKTDLAKVWMTWWEKPHIVSKGAQKNFSAFMTDIVERHESGWQPDEEFYRRTVAMVLLFKGCQLAVRKSSLPSYGANVVTYMMAKLKVQFEERLNLAAIWDSQALSQGMFDLLLDWAPLIHQAIMESAGSRNVTEYSKKDECWEAILSLKLPVPETLPPEIVGAVQPARERPDTAEEEGAELIERCKALDGAAWATIFAWATSSPMVTDFERRVTHTLLGYALGRWAHSPSEKQARIGVRVLDAAEQAGAFPAVA